MATQLTQPPSLRERISQLESVTDDLDHVASEAAERHDELEQRVVALEALDARWTPAEPADDF